jgi:hypothetical protein
VREAFVSALSTGLTVATAVVLVSALCAWALIGRVAAPAPAAPEALPVTERERVLG